MEDYELFQSCNVLTVEEGHNGDEFPREFREMKEGDAPLDETPAHAFTKGEPIKYNEATLQTMNLGDEADESTSKKVELQQNESEKEIEVTVKIMTKQELSEKMEINEIVEKKIENEESEGKRKKSKKRKQANKVKGGEVKKITEEDREGKKIPPEVKKKTTVEEVHTKKITEEEGEVKKITQGEGQLRTTKVDGKVEKKPEDDRRVSGVCPDRGPADTFFAGRVSAGSLLFPAACLYLPRTFVVRLAFYSPWIASWCLRAHLVH